MPVYNKPIENVQTEEMYEKELVEEDMFSNKAIQHLMDVGLLEAEDLTKVAGTIQKLAEAGEDYSNNKKVLLDFVSEFLSKENVVKKLTKVSKSYPMVKLAIPMIRNWIEKEIK